MSFKLCLRPQERIALLPFNYQYALSAAIYRIIARADAPFAAFLHNTGYGHQRSFKLFTFSDIRTPFVKQGDRMRLTTDSAELIISFYLPEAAERFVCGLFLQQQLEVGDAKSGVVFDVVRVESLPKPLLQGRVLLQPLSPIVVGRKNERGHYDYRSPEDADFCACLYYNWIEKCAAVGLPVAVGDEEPEVSIGVLFLQHPPQQRLITIKGGTHAETKIRGYTRFRLAVTAPAEMLEVLLGSGAGLYNAMGMGCVGISN